MEATTSGELNGMQSESLEQFKASRKRVAEAVRNWARERDQKGTPRGLSAQVVAVRGERVVGAGHTIREAIQAAARELGPEPGDLVVLSVAEIEREVVILDDARNSINSIGRTR